VELSVRKNMVSKSRYTQALLASILEPDPAKRLPEISLDATFPNPG
jgi:hypothetical protein